MSRTRCMECGMYTEPNEYHPYAACMMFKFSGDEKEVSANLAAVIDHGLKYHNPELDELRAENERLKDALTKLVALKDHREKYGKDKWYLRYKERTWDLARQALKSCGVDVNNTHSRG